MLPSYWVGDETPIPQYEMIEMIVSQLQAPVYSVMCYGAEAKCWPENKFKYYTRRLANPDIKKSKFFQLGLSYHDIEKPLSYLNTMDLSQFEGVNVWGSWGMGSKWPVWDKSPVPEYYKEILPPPPDPCADVNAITTQSQCEACGFFWYDGKCHLTAKPVNGCVSAFLLTSAGISSLLPYLRLFRSHLNPVLVSNYYMVSEAIMKGVRYCVG